MLRRDAGADQWEQCPARKGARAAREGAADGRAPFRGPPR